jgi:diguanylate cyclase (GGDEF)-like protein
LNWSGIPNLVAGTFLICAFVSIARNSRMPVSGLWYTGWLMILLHSASRIFTAAPGIWGKLVNIVLWSSLAWAGMLFMYSSIPYRQDRSSRWMLGSLSLANTLYIIALTIAPSGHWTLKLAAAALGIIPFAVTLASIRRVNHPLRWILVFLYASLSVVLLNFQDRPGNGHEIALNAVMFTVYMGCCVLMLVTYRRPSSGAFITIAGFFSWASTYVAMPVMHAYMLNARLDSEVWNLPKFLVALGMILLLLEDQIEHNKYLALHDELTGLPNRRLFHDRLANALERARRSGAKAALLLVDLDHFKNVNDSLGHHVGDLLLARVGAICSGRVRRSDTVARTGGDEFSVILEVPTSREDAENVGHSLIQLLREPLQLESHTVRIGASIGIAVFPEDASDMDSLCIAADLRMYENKQRAAYARIALLAAAPETPS